MLLVARVIGNVASKKEPLRLVLSFSYKTTRQASQNMSTSVLFGSKPSFNSVNGHVFLAEKPLFATISSQSAVSSYLPSNVFGIAEQASTLVRAVDAR